MNTIKFHDKNSSLLIIHSFRDGEFKGLAEFVNILLLGSAHIPIANPIIEITLKYSKIKVYRA